MRDRLREDGERRWDVKSRIGLSIMFSFLFQGRGWKSGASSRSEKSR